MADQSLPEGVSAPSPEMMGAMLRSTPENRRPVTAYEAPDTGFSIGTAADAAAAQFQIDHGPLAIINHLRGTSSVDDVGAAGPDWNPYAYMKENWDDATRKSREFYIRNGAFDHAVSPRDVERIAQGISTEEELRHRAAQSDVGQGIGSALALALNPAVYVPVVGQEILGARLVGVAARAAINAAAGDVLNEAVLQNVQELRTIHESMFNIGGSAIFGGGLGAIAHGLGRTLGRPVRVPTATEREAHLAQAEKALLDDPTGGGRAVTADDSFGAAGSGISPTAEIDFHAPAPTKAGGVTRMDKILGAFNPFVHIMDASSDVARNVGTRIGDFNAVMLSKGDGAGVLVPTPVSAEALKIHRVAQWFNIPMRLAEQEVSTLNKALGDLKAAAISTPDYFHLVSRDLNGIVTSRIQSELVAKYGQEGADKITAAATKSADLFRKVNKEQVEPLLVQNGIVRDVTLATRTAKDLKNIRQEFEMFRAMRAEEKATLEADARKFLTKRDADPMVAEASRKKASDHQKETDRLSKERYQDRIDSLQKEWDKQKSLPAPLGDQYGHARIYDMETIARNPSVFRQFLYNHFQKNINDEWLLENHGITSDELQALARTDAAKHRAIWTEWLGDEHDNKLASLTLSLRAATDRWREAKADIHKFTYHYDWANRDVRSDERKLVKTAIEKETAERDLKRAELAKARVAQADFVNATRALQRNGLDRALAEKIARKKADAAARLDLEKHPVPSEWTSVLAAARNKNLRPRGEVSAVKFIRQGVRDGNGKLRHGIRDPGGELAQILDGSPLKNKLINNESGASLDTVREALTEAGYIGKGDGEDITGGFSTGLQDVLDVIEAEVRGEPNFGRTTDHTTRQRMEAASELERILSDNGLSIHSSDKEIGAALRKMSQDTERDIRATAGPDDLWSHADDAAPDDLHQALTEADPTSWRHEAVEPEEFWSTMEGQKIRSVGLARLEGAHKELQKRLAGLERETARAERRVGELEEVRTRYEASSEAARDARAAMKDAKSFAEKQRALSGKNVASIARQEKSLEKAGPVHEIVDELVRKLATRGETPWTGGETLHGVGENARMKERTLRFAPDELDWLHDQGFLKHNLQTILHKQYTQLAGNLSVREALGVRPGGQYENVSDVLRMVSDDYRAKIEAAGTDEKAKTRILQEQAKTERSIATMLDRVLERTPTDGDPANVISWGARFGLKVAASNYGPMFGLASLTDLTGTLLRHKLGDIIDVRAKKMLSRISDLDRETQIALFHSTEFGLEQQKSINSMKFNEWTSEHGIGVKGSAKQQITSTLDWVVGKANGMAHTVSGMGAVQNVLKLSAGLDTQNKLARWAALGWDKLSDKEQANLLGMGLDKAALENLNEAFQKYGARVDHEANPDPNGLFRTNLENWDLRDRNVAQAHQDFALAIRRAQAQASPTMGVADTPRMMSSQLGQILMQFQSINFVVYNRIVASAIQRFTQLNDWRAVGALASSVPMIALNWGVRDALMGRNPADRWTDPKRRGELMIGIADRAGFLGYLSPYVDAAGKFSGMSGVGSRYSQNNWYQSLLGTQFTQLEGTAGFLGKTRDAITGDGDWQSVAKAGARITPFGAWARPMVHLISD